MNRLRSEKGLPPWDFSKRAPKGYFMCTGCGGPTSKRVFKHTGSKGTFCDNCLYLEKIA